MCPVNPNDDEILRAAMGDLDGDTPAAPLPAQPQYTPPAPQYAPPVQQYAPPVPQPAVKQKPKRKKHIGLIVAAVLVIACVSGFVATHIHTCERCNKKYFGVEYRIDEMGMDKDCAKEYFNELTE